MQRKNFLANLTLQLDNPVQPPQFQSAALLSWISTIIGDDGAIVYQPTYRQEPAIPADFDDELLATLNAQMAKLGLVINRLPAEPGPGPEPEAQA